MSIRVENLSHIYNPGTPFETRALHHVDLHVEKGEFVGLIGHTGSGKSTLIQHLNGLLKPTHGKIIIDGLDLTSTGTKMKEVRKKVGLVFQYPEHQLFEESVEKDIAFGPHNLGLNENEVKERVDEAMRMVRLPFEIKERSPFELSGGQRRRVAIAGVLAMKPDVLILDEPTASLDPRGRDEILEQIQELHKEQRITVILVSHSMEDIGRLVDRIVVMHQGTIALTGYPRDVFCQVQQLQEMGLGVPQITHLMREMNRNGFSFPEDVYTVQDAGNVIMEYLRGKGYA